MILKQQNSHKESVCVFLMRILSKQCMCVRKTLCVLSSNPNPHVRIQQSLVTGSVRLCISLFVWLQQCFLSVRQTSGKASSDGARANIVEMLGDVVRRLACWPGRPVSLSQPVCWLGSNPKPQLTWVHTCGSHACECAVAAARRGAALWLLTLCEDVHLPDRQTQRGYCVCMCKLPG